MPTGKTTELEVRFGAMVAEAITAAYVAALDAADGRAAGVSLDSETRLALVEALIAEARAGRADPSHLRVVALAFVPPRLG